MSRPAPLPGSALASALALALALAGACRKDEPPPPAEPKAPSPLTLDVPEAPPVPAPPAGLPQQIPDNPDNILGAEKVALGKQLFFDKRLSKDGSASCESCHLPEKGWTDGLPLSTKVGGEVNTRHSPTLYNVAYHTAWYWDGRAPTLEKQIEAAWKGQMGADPAEVATRLAAIPGYRSQFQHVFKQEPTGDNIVMALAAFARTIMSGDAPWDKHERGEPDAVPADAIAGFKVFTEVANCAVCHAPPMYSTFEFHNVGVGMDKPNPDPGRAKVTGEARDTGAFKVPTLRSVTRSAPYLHDGSQPTLEGVVRFMAGGGLKNPHLSEKMKPAKLSDVQVQQLLAFLKALESNETIERPKLP